MGCCSCQHCCQSGIHDRPSCSSRAQLQQQSPHLQRQPWQLLAINVQRQLGTTHNTHAYSKQSACSKVQQPLLSRADKRLGFRPNQNPELRVMSATKPLTCINWLTRYSSINNKTTPQLAPQVPHWNAPLQLQARGGKHCQPHLLQRPSDSHQTAITPAAAAAAAERVTMDCSSRGCCGGGGGCCRCGEGEDGQ